MNKETTLSSWLLAQRKGSVHGTPDTPKNFKTNIVDGNYVHLKWEFPSDPPDRDDEVWYCRIYRDSSIIKEIYNDHVDYTDSTVNANSTYLYQISAVNYFFKESAISSGIIIATSPE